MSVRAKYIQHVRKLHQQTLGIYPPPKNKPTLFYSEMRNYFFCQRVVAQVSTLYSQSNTCAPTPVSRQRAQVFGWLQSVLTWATTRLQKNNNFAFHYRILWVCFSVEDIFLKFVGGVYEHAVYT